VTKAKPAEPIPEPLPTLAQPERPRSSDPERMAIRVDGITYLIPVEQAGSFKARLFRQAKRDEQAEIYS
jgi:hypothetical protein